MKNYLTPIAILIGSIIISVSVYLAITSKERARFNYCVETNSKKYSEAPLEETKKLCRALQHL